MNSNFRLKRFCLLSCAIFAATFLLFSSETVGQTLVCPHWRQTKVCPTVSFSFAQSKKRDHLTEQEVEQVRENQEIDKRIEVFIKACDRRILVLANPNATQKKKEEEVWGPLPTGTKAELLGDYKRILEEAEEKMDDAFAREASNPAFKKALSKFKDAANKQIPQLRALASQMTDKKDQRALEEAIEEAETVTKASTEK